jgi:hypothetical protein
MKLTTKNLKELINEVMNEVRLEPDYSNFASDDQITKIRSLLDSGDPESINMAKTLLDALGADPSYFDDYMQNQEVGEVEKLSNKHGADGANFYGLDALGEYFTELDKFEDREVKRGRLLPDPSVEFHDRYQSVADTYEPKGLSESYEGDDSILEQFRGATLEEGDLVCEACLFEQLQEASCGCPDLMGEAEYQGKKVTLNKPTRGDVKKFKVYVKDPKTGNVKKVNFGHGGSSAKAKGEKTMKIRKNNPKARKSFRARHNCDNPGPKTKARYWSCKKW